jgi:hypothetical protein
MKVNVTLSHTHKSASGLKHKKITQEGLNPNVITAVMVYLFFLESNSSATVNDKFKENVKRSFVTYFKLLSYHLSGNFEGKRRFCLSFEPRTS